MDLTRAEIVSWLNYFNEKGLIKNYEMHKGDARSVFYKRKFNKSHTFGALLKGLNVNKINQRSSKHSTVLSFHPNVLDKILNENTGIGQSNGMRKSKMVKRKANQVYKCKICLVEFQNNNELENHQNNDVQHYFRTLYFNNSTDLRFTSKDIKIEIVKGTGTDREAIFLKTGTRTLTNIFITNFSRQTYILRDIVELHHSMDCIKINTRNVPYKLCPNGSITLNIESIINRPYTFLFTNVFLFENATSSTNLDLLKEVMIHVSGDTILTPDNKELKPKLSNTRSKYVPAHIPMSSNMYPVELGKYNVPLELRRLLAADLKPFNGMLKTDEKYLNEIMSLVPKNINGGSILSKPNYVHLLDVLIHMEEYQMSVDIKHYNTVTNGLVKVAGYNDRFRLSVPDLAERRPSLLPGDSVYIKGQDRIQYQGVVRFIDRDSVILEFNKKFARESYAVGMDLSVTYGYNRTTIRTEHRSVDLLGQHRVLTPFFPTKISTTTVKQYDIKWINKDIKSNPEQQQAVRHILSKTSRPAPYLIFGPPGTGKTMTIVEAICQVWKLKSKSYILVCAPSNSVANEIALRLTYHVPKSQLFRYMSISYGMYDIPDKVLPFTNYDEGDFYQPTSEEVCSYRIVIATLSTSSKLVGLDVPANHFTYVFIDESGHATETETLLPIAGLLTDECCLGNVSGQVVLAGDPEQLGPIIHSPFARNYGYGISMLERLMETVELYKRDSSGKYNPLALTKLVLNYRSHPAILRLPNNLFYEGELVPRADKSVVNIALNWDMLPNKSFPIIFHTVIGTDQREKNSPSYFNKTEIEMVLHYLNNLIGKRLSGRKIEQSDIGVIAPYRKQVQKLRTACQQKKWDKLTIGSVEQFQGQERLIIIISTVRSKPKLLKFDNKYHLGFLNNPKRFNVAVTRAKALVIVVGNPNLLQYESYWRRFIQYCIDNGAMAGEKFKFSYEAEDLLALDMAKLRIDGVPDDSADFSRGNI